MVFCIIYGFLIDKVKQSKLLIIILSVAAISFFSFNGVEGAHDYILYFSVLVASVALPGIFTFASFLSYRYYSPEHRGILMGISAIFGVAGVVTVMVIGGFLFDSWSRNGPFILYALLILITLGMVIWYKVRGKIN